MKSHERVTVVGAGVIGLSTAIAAQRAGLRVEIISSEEPEETTSYVAAASFKPFDVVDDDLTRNLAAKSWEEFAEIEADPDWTGCGVRTHRHWEASTGPIERWYSEIVGRGEHHEGEVPGGFRFGWTYRTFMIEMPTYLPHLFTRFTNQGGKFVKRALRSLEEIDPRTTSVVVNCSGFGARRLVGDEDVVAIKGQVALIPPINHMDYSVSGDGFYCYPRSKDVILGGTEECDVETRSTDAAVIDLIVRGNTRTLGFRPPIDSVRSAAGIRPFRTSGVRIEAEQLGSLPVVHAYGHGGSGVTLSWGTAETVVSILAGT